MWPQNHMLFFILARMFSLKCIFSKKTPSLAMKKFLIVGLGNIGDQYQNTRHNIGFSILDHIASINECLWESKKLANYTVLKKKGRQFILIKPTTFMNRSGKAVRYWALKENIPLENILILTDEIHLPFGTLRIKAKGSPAGHNGLKDINHILSSNNYPRLRIGVGSDFEKGRQADYVLGNWSSEQEKDLNSLISSATEAIKSFCTIGIDYTMNNLNRNKL